VNKEWEKHKIYDLKKVDDFLEMLDKVGLKKDPQYNLLTDSKTIYRLPDKKMRL
jgi:hypothetical protein